MIVLLVYQVMTGESSMFTLMTNDFLDISALHDLSSSTLNFDKNCC